MRAAIALFASRTLGLRARSRARRGRRSTSRTDAEEPAGGDDLVAGLELSDELLPAPARRRRCGRTISSQKRTSIAPMKIRALSRGLQGQPLERLGLEAASSPLSIAARAPAVSSSRKRRLCRLSSRRPSSSCWLTRCRMYAREKREQAGQSQPSSSGRGSRAKRAFLQVEAARRRSARCRCGPSASAARSRTCRRRARSPRGSPPGRRCP